MTRRQSGASEYLIALALVIMASIRPCGANPRWSAEKANAWQERTGWLVGCNFSPSTAINQLEMWQAESFDPATIDRELGWAQGLGFTSIRVFLHNLPWEQDSAGFSSRIDRFLGIAHKRHIGVMFVLLDSCWDPFPKLGKQRDPKPGVHNSGWVQAPGKERLADTAHWDSLKPYIQGVLRRFGKDRRIQAWDLFNEPDNNNGSSYGQQELPNKGQLGFELLKQVFVWAKEANPTQPFTAAPWYGDWSSPEKMGEFNRFLFEESDIITFHNYGNPEDMSRRIGWLKKLGRPVICTEYMARPIGSTFTAILPILKSASVGAYNWGFVSGKTQTIYPWDSWQKTYTSEPPVWFHDIFRPDGTAYRTEEVQAIRRLTGKQSGSTAAYPGSKRATATSAERMTVR